MLKKGRIFIQKLLKTNPGRYVCGMVAPVQQLQLVLNVD